MKQEKTWGGCAIPPKPPVIHTRPPSRARLKSRRGVWGDRHGPPNLLLVLAFLAATPAWAISDPKEMLPDPKQEARAEYIGSQLRCLVCQNESIEDSNADLAKDLRAIVRERVKAGDSDKQIMDWLVARYGQFVRLKPPLMASTLILWATPFLGLLAGALAAWAARRRHVPPQQPLTALEQARVRELTGAP